MTNQATLQSQSAEAENKNPALPWYVCFTKPRQEQYAAIRLLAQGYEVYLSILKSWATQAGDWLKKQTEMLPRNAFVRPGRPLQAAGPIASTVGGSGLVPFGTLPATLF